MQIITDKVKIFVKCQSRELTTGGKSVLLTYVKICYKNHQRDLSWQYIKFRPLFTWLLSLQMDDIINCVKNKTKDTFFTDRPISFIIKSNGSMIIIANNENKTKNAIKLGQRSAITFLVTLKEEIESKEYEASQDICMDYI